MSFPTDSRLAAGLQALEQGHPQHALEHFGALLDEVPERADVLLHAGRAHAALGVRAEAERCFERALAAEPGFVAALFGLIDLYVEAGAADRAIEAYLHHEPHLPATEAMQQYADALMQWAAAQSDASPDASPDAAVPPPVDVEIRHAEALLGAGRAEEALDLLAAVLERDPGNADALNDAGHACADLGDVAEAARCFEAALGADPAHRSAFFSLLDLLVDAEAPELAVEAFAAHGGAIPEDDEKAKYAATLAAWARHQDVRAAAPEAAPGRLKVAFVCRRNAGFLVQIEEGLEALGHAVRARHFDGAFALEDVQALMDWADVVWFEWCDDLLAEASRRLRKTAAVVCRLHRFEAFSGMPAAVNWAFVDRLILVAPQMLDVLKTRVPDIEARVAVETVYNGVDLARYPFRERTPGFDLAYVGYLHGRKNPSLLLQCLHALVRRDPRYTLHVAGVHQQPEWQMYMEHLVPALGLEAHVLMDGWVEDVSTWLEDKHYLVSTSVHESFGYGIAEAMARGLKPLIHNFPGVEHLYPAELVFNSVFDFVDAVVDGPYDSAAYRRHIETRYAAADQIRHAERILEAVVEARTAARPEAAERADAALVELATGARLYAPHGDHITRAVSGGRFYEEGLLRHLAARVGPGMRIVDVGAHIGNHTVFFATETPAAEVHAFEPNPASRRLLEANVALNGLAHVTVHPYAIGAAAQRARLEQGPAGNSGMAHVALEADGDVEVRPLAALVDGPVHLMKIDTEGMAGLVLEGARALVERWRPLLVIECGDAAEYDAVAAFLAPLGYRCDGRFNHTPTLVFRHEPIEAPVPLPAFAEAVAIRPADAPPVEARVKALLAAARSASARGMAAAASVVHLATAAAAAAPRHAKVLRLAGHLAANIGIYEAAQSFLARAHAVAPDDERVGLELAQVTSMTGDLAGAAARLDALAPADGALRAEVRQARAEVGFRQRLQAAADASASAVEAPAPDAPVPTIAVLTCLWQRHALSGWVMDHYRRLRDALAPHARLELLAVGSEGAASRALAERYGFRYVEHPNAPLGAKWNAGLRALRALAPDAVFITGSDDVVSLDLLRAYAAALRAGKTLLGVTDLYVVDLPGRRACYWPGYGDEGGRRAEPLGLGRCLHRTLLDALDWTLWEPELQRALDASMIRALAGLYAAQPDLFRLALYTCERDGLFAADVKSAVNMWSFDDMIAGLDDVRFVEAAAVLERHLGADTAAALFRLAPDAPGAGGDGAATALPSGVVAV